MCTYSVYFHAMAIITMLIIAVVAILMSLSQKSPQAIAVKSLLYEQLTIRNCCNYHYKSKLTRRVLLKLLFEKLKAIVGY